MPLYEFACESCENEFESLVFGDESIECPDCHGTELQKKWSVPAKPRSEGHSLPTTNCDPGLPPCGPRCCRL